VEIIISAKHPAVEIVRDGSGNLAMKTGVNEIGTDLKGLDFKIPAAQPIALE